MGRPRTVDGSLSPAGGPSRTERLQLARRRTIEQHVQRAAAPVNEAPAWLPALRPVQGGAVLRPVSVDGYLELDLGRDMRPRSR